MKILHTADLHLKGKEHISIVESIIQTANKEEVDLIIIAGDLFDTKAKGRELEAALLSVWENFAGDIIVIPGNHDLYYLKDRTKLASNVIIANQIPYSIAQIDDINLICVPYQQGVSLSDIDIPMMSPSILIAHGTYNSDRDNIYFPIKPLDVAGRYDYVALGHYHTWFDKWEKGTLVLNPGAPRQTRKTDKGDRYVAIIDTESWLVDRVILPISFTEYKTVCLSVGDSEQEIFDKLYHAVQIISDHRYCRLNLTLQGSIFFTQASIFELLELWKQKLLEHRVDLSRIFWDVEKIVQISPDLVYSSFVRVLVDKISSEEEKQVADLAPFLFERLQQNNQKIL